MRTFIDFFQIFRGAALHSLPTRAKKKLSQNCPRLTVQSHRRGSRWNQKTVNFIWGLAKSKARQLAILQNKVEIVLVQRWPTLAHSVEPCCYASLRCRRSRTTMWTAHPRQIPAETCRKRADAPLANRFGSRLNSIRCGGPGFNVIIFAWPNIMRFLKHFCGGRAGS